MTQPSDSRFAFVPRRQEPDPAVAEAVRSAAGDIPLEVGQTRTDIDIRVTPQDLPRLVQVLAEHPALAFDFLRNITGIDMGPADGLAAKYALYSFQHGHALQLTVLTPPGNPHIPSLTSFYGAADWHEREAAEMLGLVFDGHPDLKNLLLEEDLRIHPLLKSHPLQKVEILQGIEEGPPGFKF